MHQPSVLLPRLGVNVDHVATLRQARRTAYPNPAWAAQLAELGGAAQITIHLREDLRHIQLDDLFLLRKTVGTKLNLEMAATPQMMTRAFEARPDTVTLVPERRQELTTEGGLDVAGQKDALKRFVSELKAAEIEVSLFVDPEIDQIQACYRVGADAVELHTGRYCEAFRPQDQSEERMRLVTAAKAAVKAKMRCAAGHGIHYDNVGEIASILEIEELNIGHSIVARAVLVGMKEAVREMRDLMWQARRDALLRG